MVYLSGFRFPDRAQEANYMAFSPRARQTYYDSYYPFGLFEGRTLPELDFLEITILYGGNGSGKTTLLNVMADALRLYRILLLLATGFFRLPGFCTALFLILFSIATTPTFGGFSYFWPLFPFNKKALGSLLFRSPTPKAQPDKIWHRGKVH